MDWTEMIVVKNKFEDNIVGILYLFDIDGISIKDSRDFWKNFKDKPLLGSFWYEEIFEKVNITVKTYFKNDNEILENINLLKKEKLNQFERGVWWKSHIKIDSEFKSEDWANEWKKYYKPIRVGKNFLIKPTWEKYELSDSDIMIELDRVWHSRQEHMKLQFYVWKP